MNIKTESKQNIENTKEMQIPVITKEEENIMADVNMPFSDILSGAINNIDMQNLPDIDFDYDSIAMSIEDAMFFINLTHEGQFTVEVNNEGNFQSISQIDTAQNVVSKKSVEVTNQLTNLIEKAQNTQKPVRISFDNDVSVILKIDKHGKVTAEFIPGNIEVENYLRNNIASLKQRFDEQNLPYNDLFYRQNNRQNRNKKERGEK